MADGLPLNVKLHDYVEADAAAVQRMELECAQCLSGDFPFRIVKYARIYTSPYHNRPGVFSWTQTVLAKHEAKVVGIVSGALKLAYYDNKAQKLGYIFDLRVHDEYRRQGIGLALAREMERRLQAKGAQLLYAVVYATNRAAEALFRAELGYKIATRKTIHVEDTVQSAASHGLVSVPPQEAEAHLTAFYGDKDLTLVSFQELFRAPEYLGTYSVQDSAGNRAEASLWHTTRHTARAIVQVLHPVHELWRSSFYVPFLICAVLTLVLGMAATLAVYAWIEAQLLKLLWASFMLLVGFGLAQFLWVFLKHWRVAATHPKGEQKIALFGLHYKGTAEEKEACYLALIEGLKGVCAASADMLTWTVDHSDPDRNLFTSDMHEIVYLHRKPGEEYWNAFTRNLFCDPRDLV